MPEADLSPFQVALLVTAVGLVVAGLIYYISRPPTPRF